MEKAYSAPEGTEDYVLSSTVDETVATFNQEFNRLIDEEEIFIQYPQLKKSEAEGAEMIANFYAKAPSVPGDIIGIEKDFKLPIAGILIVGKIDRIRRVPEGLIVEDYKTGKAKVDEWFLRKNLQLTAYAWACQQLYGELPHSLVWYDLRKNEMRESTRDEWDVEQLHRIVEGAIKMQKEGVRFRIYHEKLCEQCDYSGFSSYGMITHTSQCDDKHLEEEILARRRQPV